MTMLDNIPHKACCPLPAAAPHRITPTTLAEQPSSPCKLQPCALPDAALTAGAPQHLIMKHPQPKGARCPGCPTTSIRAPGSPGGKSHLQRLPDGDAQKPQKYDCGCKAALHGCTCRCRLCAQAQEHPKEPQALMGRIMNSNSRKACKEMHCSPWSPVIYMLTSPGCPQICCSR